MAFSKWKNSLKFKQELHLMEEQALHFWARTLFYKVSVVSPVLLACADLLP